MYHYAGNNPIKYTDPTGEAIAVIPFIAPTVIAGVKAIGAWLASLFVVGVAATAVGVTINNTVDNIKKDDPLLDLSEGLSPDTSTPSSTVEDNLHYKSNNYDVSSDYHENILYSSRNHPKGMPDSIDGIDRDKSGARGDRHAHGDGWAINEDGTAHDGKTGRIPKEAAEWLRGKGFNIPDDRYPIDN